MPEVAVTKTKITAPAPAPSEELLRPILPLGRWFGFNPFGLFNEMDRLFRGKTAEAIEPFAPAIDIERTDGALVVKAELPGVKKEDVKVEVGEDSLVIEGERKMEHKEEEKGYHRWEFNYGRFYRLIPLPEGAKTGEVKAELKDGILKVTIPAPETVKKTREVPIAA